jgi:hypothetical protein
MKNLLKIALFLIPQTVLALTCSGTSVKNLSNKGGSLHPLRITDQNGLGICHIEQLHKLIKARLPGHPDLSRHQMAMVEKRVRDSKILFFKQESWVNFKETAKGFRSIVIKDGPFRPTLYFRGGAP